MMLDGNKGWVKRDLQAIWHPCTQMKDHEYIPLIPIKQGRGVYLEDFEGNRYIDAVSSWWVNIMGHCHPDIANAIKQQLDTLEHVIMAGFTHEPVVELSEKLLSLSLPHFKKCFYADNGSSAVEVALKMSYHAWRNQGQSKKRLFMTMDNSYHGETLGALSVSQVGLYKNTYEDLLTPVVSLPFDLNEIERLMQQHHEETCAVIIEPLVQCAGGMQMHTPDFLKGLFDLAKQYNIHFIADEIAVGFGRTGTMFACQQANIQPDFMCLSKGITGGFLPLAVVLTTQTMYDYFYDTYESGKAFLHSHSYTGNPLACRAALATLECFEKYDLIHQNQAKIALIQSLLEPLKTHPRVKDVRQTGMIAAIELNHSPSRGQWFKLYSYGLKHGVILRPLGNVIYFMPPYVITDDEIKHMITVAKGAIDAND